MQHKLLKRQILKHLGNLKGLTPEQEACLQSFFVAVEASYKDYDDNNALLERSMSLSSEEIYETNRMVREQQAKMAATSKLSELGRMAGGMAHEINTPLAAIGLLAEQTIDNLNGVEMDPLAAIDNCRMILKSSERIGKIISALRSFARDGSQDPFSVVNLHKLFHDTLLFCQKRCEEEKISITLDIPADLGLECHPAQLAQVFLNLVMNALDAVGELPQKWVRIRAVKEMEHIKISITDSGAGLKPEIRENIFNPFFTTKEIGKGTGLGLSVSVGIVQNHQGKLYYDETCANTCFVLTLPLTQTAAPESTNKAS